MTNATGDFIGYRNNSGSVVSVNSITGLDQNQFTAIGYNGITVGNQAANIGIVEGQQAAQTSINDTYYHAENGLYYRVPTGVDYLVNGAGHFQGYQTSSGQFVNVDTLSGLTQDQYNNIGVTQGQQAATTSQTDTHVLYNNHYYTIPAGATPEFNRSGALTGYDTHT